MVNLYLTLSCWEVNFAWYLLCRDDDFCHIHGVVERMLCLKNHGDFGCNKMEQDSEIPN